VADPTPEEAQRLVQCVIAKATRILALVEAPLGTWGEITEVGVAQTRPDYQLQELLYGLRYPPYTVVDIDVGTDDVIRQGLQTDPATYPPDKLPDVQRAIDAATNWVLHAVRGFGAA
jgi:hypothetical protein